MVSITASDFTRRDVRFYSRRVFLFENFCILKSSRALLTLLATAAGSVACCLSACVECWGEERGEGREREGGEREIIIFFGLFQIQRYI